MAASSSPASLYFVAAAFVFFLLLAPPAAAITCGDVAGYLKPCVDYLEHGSGKPPPTCCVGVSGLVSSATTTADKQTACACVKAAAKNINVKLDLARALPVNCGVSLSFEISPNVDCTKIH